MQWNWRVGVVITVILARVISAALFAAITRDVWFLNTT